MSDRPLASTSTRFEEHLDRHGLLDSFRERESAINEFLHGGGGSVSEAVAWPIAVQSADQVAQDLDVLVNMRGAPADGPDLEFMFALFVYGREACDGAQIVIDRMTFGDHQNGLTDLRIQPNALRGDFKLDVLVGITEYGPNPDYVKGSDLPTDKTVVREAALVKKRRNELRDAQLRRQALKSLGITPVTYTDDEIERDPFALARRVVDDLGREARDEIYPVGS